MTLKSPSPQNGQTQASNDLQREVADRVTKRWEEQNKKERRAARISSLKNWFAIFLLCVMGCGGFYVWKRGGLEQCLMDAKSVIATVSDKFGDQKSKDTSQCDRYADAVKSFGSAKIDYWKNAPASDKPEKSAVPLDFLCLIPDDKGNPLILELHTAPGAKMTVKRISASLGTVDFPVEKFNSLIKKSPYLVVRDGRAYFADSRKPGLQKELPFPEKGALNPAAIAFGALYDVMHKLKVGKPDFRYAIKFSGKGTDEVLDVATVGFGESVDRKLLEKKVAEKIGLNIASEAVAIDAVIRMGRISIDAL
jgi:hypothetical protein